MDGCFSGVNTDNIEKFFNELISFDMALPHTTNRISPITFNDFMIRNNILCLNQEQVYQEACKYWKRWLQVVPIQLSKVQGECTLDLAEQKHDGWNILIDYFNRILDVQKYAGNPYYQMHYLSHICYLFYHESFKDREESLCYKSLFNQVISPIVYDSLVPTNYLWVPIMNFADVRFNERVVFLCANVSSFIEQHSGRTSDVKRSDHNWLTILKTAAIEGLTKVRDNRYNGDSWKQFFSNFLAQARVVQQDMRAYELHDSFERDGVKTCEIIKQIERTRKAYERNVFDDDPDGAIDEMLDAYASINTCLKSYTDNKEEK